jgi:hypothetical protein
MTLDTRTPAEVAYDSLRDGSAYAVPDLPLLDAERQMLEIIEQARQRPDRAFRARLAAGAMTELYSLLDAERADALHGLLDELIEAEPDERNLLVDHLLGWASAE